MVENGKITDSQIIELLIRHGELTVGELGEELNAKDKLDGITYHLKGLTERKIVSVKKKKKGSLYRLNDKYTLPAYSSIAVFITALTFCGVGIYGLTVNEALATPFLLVTSLIGVSTSFINTIQKKREKLKVLRELVA